MVVSIIALLIAILLPSLTKAREQAKQVVCLANLKAFGQGIHTYSSEYGGVLPGPLHPAVYREQSYQSYIEEGYAPASAKYSQERQLTWKLRSTFRDSSEVKGSMTDRVGTCPALAKILPASHFKDFKTQTTKGVFPTHYVLNDWGPNTTDGIGSIGPVGNVRTTAPAYYFGLSPPPPGTTGTAIAPQNIGAIKNASAEWIVADAWYRPRSSGWSFLQQEGPYQSAWSGEAFPNFAPHMSRYRRGYVFKDTGSRSTECSAIRSGRQDGVTETLFLDSHAAPVRSKKAFSPIGAEMFYGFSGTINPGLDATGMNQWKSLRWE